LSIFQILKRVSKNKNLYKKNKRDENKWNRIK
jgi:hypothetical protein